MKAASSCLKAVFLGAVLLKRDRCAGARPENHRCYCPSFGWRSLCYRPIWLLKKGSECFEGLSMNGKSSMISKALRSS
jgi:hypothetical protein